MSDPRRYDPPPPGWHHKQAQITHVCTKSNPWTKEKGTPAQHPDAVVVGNCGHGCCDDYRCPHCGKTWRYEYPD